MHGPQPIRPIGDVTAEPERADGAIHIARDCAGLNFYEIDRGLRDLLPLIWPTMATGSCNRISTASGTPNDAQAQQNAEKAGRVARAWRERVAAQNFSADFSRGWWRKRIDDVVAAHATRPSVLGIHPQDCWDKVLATVDEVTSRSATGSIP
jgi:hypothetical protein